MPRDSFSSSNPLVRSAAEGERLSRGYAVSARDTKSTMMWRLSLSRFPEVPEMGRGLLLLGRRLTMLTGWPPIWFSLLKENSINSTEISGISTWRRLWSFLFRKPSWASRGRSDYLTVAGLIFREKESPSPIRKC